MSDFQAPQAPQAPGLIGTSDCKQESDSVLWKPLDDSQRSLLESVGNKRLARRLYKRTFKIYSREDRLHAIEFCQTRKHIDPITGQERPISISTASEILHISRGTLQRWITETQKITNMKHGSSRAERHRAPPSILSDQYGTDNYAFLRLLPQQLFQHHFIQRSEFYRVRILVTRLVELLLIILVTPSRASSSLYWDRRGTPWPAQELRRGLPFSRPRGRRITPRSSKCTSHG